MEEIKMIVHWRLWTRVRGYIQVDYTTTRFQWLYVVMELVVYKGLDV